MRSEAVCLVCGGVLTRLTPRLWAHEPVDLRRFGLHKARPHA